MNPTSVPMPAPTSMPTADPTSVPMPAPSSEPTDGFQLLWEDQFDSLDASRWAPQTHSWDGNLAQFTANNVAVADGRLQLALTSSGNTDKPYDGVEYRSIDTITFGKVEASMRFAKGSGVVSSLVLIYTPWPPDDWNELDIECLGNTTGEVQFNHMVNIPPADPETEHLQFPEKIDLGFDPTSSFHTYTIEWLPNSVRFFVDGVVVHEPTEEISRLVLPQNILLTIWASDAAAWAGPIDATTAPTAAEVDWIRVYSYTGP
jgi:beta-glucanase (GH16 family)